MRNVDRDDGRLEALVAAAADGDTASWWGLWEDVEPWLDKVVGNPRFLGRLGRRDDDRSNIMVAVMARLHADGFHRLRVYVETRRSNPHLKFKTWLRVVAKRVGIDYLRGHDGYLDRRRERDQAPGTWVEVVRLPSRLAVDRPHSACDTARELSRYAARTIPEPQLSALALWTQGASFDDIARELEIASGSPAAERLVRAAIERLRRRFRSGEPDSTGPKVT